MKLGELSALREIHRKHTELKNSFYESVNGVVARCKAEPNSAGKTVTALKGIVAAAKRETTNGRLTQKQLSQFVGWVFKQQAVLNVEIAKLVATAGSTQKIGGYKVEEEIQLT